jgi:hypothetical protein
MSETQKIILAIVGVFVIGFIMVGLSKEDQTTEQMEAASMIRNYVAMQTMATEKCTKIIKEKTGEQIFFPSDTKSDKETYITLKWAGENAQKGGFKQATCTLDGSIGGISELIIDDKVIINKKAKN